MARVPVSGMSFPAPVERCSIDVIDKKITEFQDSLRGVPLAILQKMHDAGEPVEGLYHPLCVAESPRLCVNY